jgi:hypothetical protein
MGKLKLYALAAFASLMGIIMLVLRGQKRQLSEAQKELLIQKHRNEWERVRKEVQDAKTKSAEADVKAKNAEIAYRSAVRRITNPDGK